MSRVSLEGGRAIPSARGGTLAFYCDGGGFQVEATAHELVHLATGHTSAPAIEEGCVIHVAEALTSSAQDVFPQFGQAVDRWVTLFDRQGTLSPLERVLDTIAFQWSLDGLPEDSWAWQTYVEVGS